MRIVVSLVVMNSLLWTIPFIFFFASGNVSNSTNNEISDVITSISGFSYPVNEPYVITQGFGVGNDGSLGYISHAGVDFVPSEDHTVISGSTGEVVATNTTCPPHGGYLGSRCGGGFGNYIYVETKVGEVSYRVIYGHLSEVDVSIGDKVVNGESIGVMGNSGNTSGAHVHYEIQLETSKGIYTPINPMPLLVINNSVDSEKISLMKSAGIAEEDYEYVDYIISHESSWDYKADNPSSSAYGLCQALPGEKMATAGSDWKTNPETQMKWCNTYAIDRYGSWEVAYDYWVANNWW